MNANDVIESYVTDVALQLPRRQRNDVAYELRALLDEGLQDKAEASGRAIDTDMAVELANAFGRPEDVASRYRPALTIIDPADGHTFLRWTWVGLAVIWLLGALSVLQQPADLEGSVLRAVAQWWLGTVVPSLWWPGMLVVGYAMAAWVRARRPTTTRWKPRAGDRIAGGRAALVMAMIGIACGAFVLFEPRWILDFFFDGRAAPAAYDALTYTETFRQRQGPWLFLCILLNLPLMATVIVQGRWTMNLRRTETALSLVTFTLMIWTVLDGPVFNMPVSDQTAKACLVLILAFTAVGFAVKAYRRIKPAPNALPPLR